MGSFCAKVTACQGGNSPVVVADVIADDFARILRGAAPQAALTREAMRVRTEAAVPGTPA